MFTPSRTTVLNCATVGVFVALAFVSTSIHADELAVNLRPVGPHEPILTSIGDKQVVAYFTPDDGRCSLNAVTWEDVEAKTAAQIRVSLTPGEIAQIDGTGRNSLNLQCGVEAQSLAIVGTAEITTAAAE